MTAQQPDRIRFEPDGEIHFLCTNPLDDWLWELGVGFRPVQPQHCSSANWRGHTATYLLHDGHLWIEAIHYRSSHAVAAPVRRQRLIVDPESPSGHRWEVESPEDFARRRADTDPASLRLFTLEGLFPSVEDHIAMPETATGDRGGTADHEETPAGHSNEMDTEEGIRRFPRDGEGRVRADWYTGELRIPSGRMTRYVHGGYGSQFQRDRLVMVERGVVIRDWVRENG